MFSIRHSAKGSAVAPYSELESDCSPNRPTPQPEWCTDMEGMDASKGSPEGGEHTEDEKSKKPDGRAFFQQKLPAWEPVMTADWGSGIFLVMGIISLAVGIPLLIASNELSEHIIHYGDDCVQDNGETCLEYFENDANNAGNICNCTVDFTLENELKGEIFMYYGMRNFFQNHRQYSKSRDYKQLKGEFRSVRDRWQENKINEDCEPLRYYANGSEEYTPFAPCGLVANSLFNDSMTLFYEGTSEEVPLNKRNLAWTTDKKDLFINPPFPPGGSLKDAFNDTEKPPNWQKEPWQLDEDDDDNNGYENEDFIVWMKPATFPHFRKLYRRVNNAATFQNGLPAGNYKLNVSYAFPTHHHEGDKTVILTNLSWAGGKNPFLGILAIVVAVMCLLLSVGFFGIHMYTKDWDNDLRDAPNNRREKEGIDNPMMMQQSPSQSLRGSISPDAWRRRLAGKSSSVGASSSAAKADTLTENGVNVMYNMDLAGNSDLLGLSGVNRSGSREGYGSSNVHIPTETISMWM